MAAISNQLRRFSMRRSAVLVLAAIVAAPCIAGAAGDTNEQLIKHYRKKNNIPSTQKVTVTGLKDSTIKGAKEGTLEIGDGPGAQKVPFIASPDLRYAAFGAQGDTSMAKDVTIGRWKGVMEWVALRGEPRKGPESAKVTSVEYSDFQWPLCSRC